MPNIGPTELIIMLVIVLVIFGPKRLPGLGKQLGSGMRDFKEAVTSKHDDDEDEDGDKPALTAAPPSSDAVPAPAPTAGSVPVTTPPVAAPAPPPERTGKDA